MKFKVETAAAVAFAAVCLSGCASIISGTSQQIMVNTNPNGASCQLIRGGSVIARVDQTPGGVTIDKTKYDIVVKCNKDGYQEASYYNHSGIDYATYGNAIIGGLAGWGIDSSLGSDNSYDGWVNVSLVPDGSLSAARSDNSSCSHEQQVQARIARMNHYTGGPKCD